MYRNQVPLFIQYKINDTCITVHVYMHTVRNKYGICNTPSLNVQTHFLSWQKLLWYLISISNSGFPKKISMQKEKNYLKSIKIKIKTSCLLKLLDCYNKDAFYKAGNIRDYFCYL